MTKGRKKSMAYVIPKAKPFVIKGEKGEYLIPAMSKLGTADLGDVLTITPSTTIAEKAVILKAFLLRMAPDLDKEELGDFGYLQIYQAYEQEQQQAGK